MLKTVVILLLICICIAGGYFLYLYTQRKNCVYTWSVCSDSGSQSMQISQNPTLFGTACPTTTTRTCTPSITDPGISDTMADRLYLFNLYKNKNVRFINISANTVMYPNSDLRIMTQAVNTADSAQLFKIEALKPDDATYSGFRIKHVNTNKYISADPSSSLILVTKPDNNDNVNDPTTFCFGRLQVGTHVNIINFYYGQSILGNSTGTWMDNTNDNGLWTVLVAN